MTSPTWAVRDKLTGEVYPQPNRLIAERVAEMHGSSEVVATETVTMEYREVKRMQVAPEDIPAFEAGGWRVAEDDPYEYGWAADATARVWRDTKAEAEEFMANPRRFRRLKAGPWHEAPEED